MKFPELPDTFSEFRNVIIDTLSVFLDADRVADYVIALYDEASYPFKEIKTFWEDVSNDETVSSWVEIDGALFELVQTISIEMKERVDPFNFALRFDEVLFGNQYEVL